MMLWLYPYEAIPNDRGRQSVEEEIRVMVFGFLLSDCGI
jgi:hypothetical protein